MDNHANNTHYSQPPWCSKPTLMSAKKQQSFQVVQEFSNDVDQWSLWSMNADLVQVSLPAREGCGQQSQTGQMQNSTQLKDCFDVIYGSMEEDRSAHYCWSWSPADRDNPAELGKADFWRSGVTHVVVSGCPGWRWCCMIYRKPRLGRSTLPNCGHMMPV